MLEHSQDAACCLIAIFEITTVPELFQVCPALSLSLCFVLSAESVRTKDKNGTRYQSLM